MLRLGIAGCGWAGERHYEAAESVDGVEVVAIADADEDTRNARAGEWGVESFADYGALIEGADLDALVVALPHHLHEDAAIRAARAGLDVLCEKPIARTLDEADAMLDAAEASGTRLVVAESARYRAWTRTVENLLADGAVGHPVFARYDWLHDFGSYRYDRADWLNDPERLGGGQWHLNGVHLVSPLRGWFSAGGAGDVATTFAREYRSPAYEAPDGIEANVGATLAFDGGETATVAMGMETPHHDRFNGVRIHGTGGTLVVDRGSERIDVYDADATEPESHTVADDDAFVAQLRAFVDAVRDGAPTRSEGRRERDTLAVVAAGYESMDRGESVDVDRR